MSPVTLLYWSILYTFKGLCLVVRHGVDQHISQEKKMTWICKYPTHLSWKLQLMISSWIWLALPNLISFAFVSTYHNYFRKSYQNMKLVLLWKPESHSPFFPTKTCSLVRMVNSIPQWSIIIYKGAFLTLWKPVFVSHFFIFLTISGELFHKITCMHENKNAGP